jgi:hypothetical protein
MGAGLAVAAIIFVAGLAVGGILMIALGRGRKRPSGGGTIQPGPDESGWPDEAPDDRPRWPGDAGYLYSLR